MDWKKTMADKLKTVEEAALYISSGDRVWIGSGSIAVSLLNEICGRCHELRDVKLITSNTLEKLRCMTDPDCFGHIELCTVFLGAADRACMPGGNIQVSSVSYYRVIRALREVYRMNAVALEVSTPDEEGWLYYGPYGVGWSHAVGMAEKKIFQMNSFQPKVRGSECRIHVSEADVLCRCDHPMLDYHFREPSDNDKRIAAHISPFISDGDNIQIGFGGVANAVAYELKNKKDLGIHTEVLTDSLAELIRCGAVDKSRMKTCFAMGATATLDYMADCGVEFGQVDVLNDPFTAGRVPRLISINSCLMCDLTGQVCSESIGTRQFSGPGGQLDYVRAAAISEGGKSFLCLPSTHADSAGKLSSNIGLTLPLGAVVTTPRTDAMFIVTEWGAADVFCQPLEVRAKRLIAIAHPDFRDLLYKEAVASRLIRA